MLQTLPVESGYHPINLKHNLPAQITSFVGRQREINAIKQLLGVTRLLTLSGPPGTGKTRLALEVAGQTSDRFQDGAFFVDLAPITDPRLVLSTIAQTLDLKEAPSQPLMDTLTYHLRDKQILLLLDNFEQIIEAAPLVCDLLSACPGLKVLVTSREPLRVYGEQEYPVPPLTVPDPVRPAPLRVLSQYEAVELFSQRAKAVKPDFMLSEENAPAVSEICVRLDGLPLAIELAAARSKLLSPENMCARLESRLMTLTGGARDLPARLQTLRAAIDWSYNLLDADEKRLSEAGDLKRRHAMYFVALAEHAEAELHGVRQGYWYAHLTDELDNIRTVLNRVLDDINVELGARLVATLREFWYWKGFLSESSILYQKRWATDNAKLTALGIFHMLPTTRVIITSPLNTARKPWLYMVLFRWSTGAPSY